MAANDYEKGMINLGKKTRSGDMAMPMETDSSTKKSKGKETISYPSLYIANISELDNLPDGEFYFMAKGQVTSHTERNPVEGTPADQVKGKSGDYGQGCSCDITVISMKPMGAASKSAPVKDGVDKLDETLSAIEKKKQNDEEDAESE